MNKIDSLTVVLSHCADSQVSRGPSRWPSCASEHRCGRTRRGHSWSLPRSADVPSTCHVWWIPSGERWTFASRRDERRDCRMCLLHTSPSALTVFRLKRHRRAVLCPSWDPECTAAGTLMWCSPAWGSLEVNRDKKRRVSSSESTWEFIMFLSRRLKSNVASSFSVDKLKVKTDFTLFFYSFCCAKSLEQQRVVQLCVCVEQPWTSRSAGSRTKNENLTKPVCAFSFPRGLTMSLPPTSSS